MTDEPVETIAWERVASLPGVHVAIEGLDHLSLVWSEPVVGEWGLRQPLSVATARSAVGRPVAVIAADAAVSGKLHWLAHRPAKARGRTGKWHPRARFEADLPVDGESWDPADGQRRFALRVTVEVWDLRRPERVEVHVRARPVTQGPEVRTKTRDRVMAREKRTRAQRQLLAEIRADGLITPDEACEMIGCGPGHLDSLVAVGWVKVQRRPVGHTGRVRGSAGSPRTRHVRWVDRRSVEAYIADCAAAREVLDPGTPFTFSRIGVYRRVGWVVTGPPGAQGSLVDVHTRIGDVVQARLLEELTLWRKDGKASYACEIVDVDELDESTAHSSDFMCE